MARRTTSRTVLVIANVLLIVGLVGATAYLFVENSDLNDQITLTTEEKNARLIQEINEVYDLPDEEPVVAVVTDPGEFKQQYTAFDNAESGDYLLFYRKARLNILYRQSEKRVVKTANVVVPIAIELVGTQEAIDEAEVTLGDFGNQITIVKTVDDSVKQAFIFDVDSDQADELKAIADLLGVEVGLTLPSSLSPSENTEIVIVVTKAATPPPAQ